MMVRTIQHPGVEIKESEIGSYRSTVVMNNAYIMGFADRGPIYDYQWITTTKEFTKIYGEPQTEAEKFLFIAVQSVLQNGGTPIVARMPYDNKQCKAYKALKMKWSDVKPDNSRLDSPIVPLSSLTDKIDMNKSFKDILTTKTVTINDQPATEEDLSRLTLSQLTMQLNPYKSGSASSNGEIYDDFIYGLKINGVYPSGLNISQEAVSSLVDSLKYDATKIERKFYKYDEGYNRMIYADLSGEIVNGAISEAITDFYMIANKYTKVTFKDKGVTHSFYISHIAAAVPESGSVYNGENCYQINAIPYEIGVALTGIFKDGSDSFIKANKNEAGNIMSFELIPASSWIADSVLSVPSLNGKLSAEIENGEPVGFVVLDPQEASFVIQPSVIYDGVQYPVYRAGVSGIYDEAIAPYLKNEDGSVMDFETISGKFTVVNSLDLEVFGIIGSNSAVESSEMDIDQLLPLFTNTCNGRLSGSNGVENITFEALNNAEPNKYQLTGFYNADTEAPAVTGIILGSDVKNIFGDALPGIDPDKEYPVYSVYSVDKITNRIPGIDPNDGEKMHNIIDFGLSTNDEFRFAKTNWSRAYCFGKIIIPDRSYNVVYNDVLDSICAIDITNDCLHSKDTESIMWLKTIYNSPYFINLDESAYTNIEASLLATPEMGFKNMLLLDSEDCEISNDQYDDLVTVNQFKAVDRTLDKYGQDIDDANFIIVDKQKTVVQGVGGNIGYFTVVVDPFDALKVQRLLVSPTEKDPTSRTVIWKDDQGQEQTQVFDFDHTSANINRMDYWAYEAADAWNKIYDDLMDSMDCLQRVRNADGVYIGEPNPIDGKLNILDSWSIPLTGGYYDESISKLLMKKFPAISMASISADDLTDGDNSPSIIDHSYATHVMVAVCKTTIDQSNGKIVVNLVETFFGSLFNEKNLQNGRSLFIGDIINANSEFIEFYRNNYVSAGEPGAYDPPEYRRTEVNQIFLKDTEELKNAAMMRGIDYEDYGCEALDEAVREAAIAQYYKDLEDRHIYAIDKKEVCVYNVHWEANLTSFSKKESQKVIANTSSLYSVADGTTVNVAKNFLIDMDRCIKFIKNIDDIPLHFICDAGLTTIAQFCDNVVWNPNKMSVVGERVDLNGKKTGVKIYEKTGGWITQPFDPDNDPDGEDRYITGYEDVATWRKVAEKIISIAGEIRKDCFAIIDAPRQLTLDGAAPKIRRTKFTNNFDKTIGRCLRYISGINSSYAAGYYNWLRTTDQYSGRSIWIPPTTKIIGNYCYLNINNLPWLAPAGLTYGLISGCHAISHNPDYQEEDQIYMKSWNYIKQYPMEGLVVEGQKTLLGKESVFERLNVRLLFLDLERFTYNVSRNFKYQVNNAYTREQFVQTLKPKFEDYTLRGGIYEYLIKCDAENNTPETIDANELRGDIFIKPARLIEFILLNFVGTSTATDFTELQLG